MLFATTDLAFNALAVWLAQNDLIATSAVVNEIVLRVLPVAITGLVAGFLALPHGFSAAAFAGLTGAVVSLAIRCHDTAFWATPGLYNTSAIVSWFASMAIASGICGWAGERLRTKAGLRPNKSLRSPPSRAE